jgi:hypothetical protein
MEGKMREKGRRRQTVYILLENFGAKVCKYKNICVYLQMFLTKKGCY